MLVDFNAELLKKNWIIVGVIHSVVCVRLNKYLLGIRAAC